MYRKKISLRAEWNSFICEALTGEPCHRLGTSSGKDSHQLVKESAHRTTKFIT